MFIGHYGLALAAKRVAPRTSLGTLIAAAQLVDLIWPVFLLLGIEHVRVTENANPFLRLTFESYPWTHSLAMTMCWGVAAAFVLGARRDRSGAVIIGLLVLSHWVLDLATHLPDLPIYPGGPRVGLGLWRSINATMIAEAVLFAVGLVVYVRSTRPIDGKAKWTLTAFVVFLAVLYLANAYGPPPASATAVAWGALGGWLVPLFGWWVDTHRAPAMGTRA